MTRARVAFACLLFAAVTNSGCSGDSDDNPADTTTSSSPAPTTTAAENTTSVPSTGTGTTTGETEGVASNLLPPVGVGDPAELGGNLFVTVTRVDPTTFTAEGPGQTSGPGIIVTVEIRNDTNSAVDLTGFVINAHYGDGTPAVPNLVLGGALEGSLAPGTSKTGEFGFRVPQGEEGSVVIDLQHSAAPNIAVVYVDR